MISLPGGSGPEADALPAGTIASASAADRHRPSVLVRLISSLLLSLLGIRERSPKMRERLAKRSFGRALSYPAEAALRRQVACSLTSAGRRCQPPPPLRFAGARC